jgi:hypothetical protein
MGLTPATWALGQHGSNQAGTLRAGVHLLFNGIQARVLARDEQPLGIHLDGHTQRRRERHVQRLKRLHTAKKRQHGAQTPGHTL